jgi:hypothetical protein
MDDHQKKLLAQHDDSFPAVREQALHALHEYNQKANLSYRGIVLENEKAEKYVALENKLNGADLEQLLKDFENANLFAQQENAKLLVEIAQWQARFNVIQHLKSWIARRDRRRVLAGAAVLALAVTGYQLGWYGPGTGPAAVAEREAINAGLRSLADRTPWAAGMTTPVGHMVAGKPLWVMFQGELVRGEHADFQAHDIEMRCLHVYAAPATPDFGKFRKPEPYNFLGWLKWPERVFSCKPVPLQQAEAADPPVDPPSAAKIEADARKKREMDRLIGVQR